MYKYFTTIIIATIIIFIGCESRDSTTTDLLSDTDKTGDILTIDKDLNSDQQDEQYELLSFNEVVNNPYRFESNKDSLYSFRLTDRHDIRNKYVKRPNEGEVSSIVVKGDSKDFGVIHLQIVSNDNLCFETVEKNLEELYEYILKIKIYHIENRAKDYIIVWADLLDYPEKVKI